MLFRDVKRRRKMSEREISKREISKSAVWGALLLAGVLVFPACQKKESAEGGGEAAATPAAEASAGMAEATPEPSLTSQVAGAQLSGPGGVSGVITFTQQPGG